MRPWIRTTFNLLALLVSGLALGWLIGLSVSPVVGIVVTSVIALIVGVASALTGLKNSGSSDKPEVSVNPVLNKPEVPVNPLPNKPEVPVNPLPSISINPYPLVFVVVGLAIGASVGVVARTNNWLGPRPETFINQWIVTGMTKEEIGQRVFDNLFPVTKADPSTKPAPSNAGFSPFLFNDSIKECPSFLAIRDDEDLKTRMVVGSDEKLKKEVLKCTDMFCVHHLLNHACPPK